jgi:uncharacterized membrane protein
LSRKPTRGPVAQRPQPKPTADDAVVEDLERQLEPILQNLPKVQRDQVLQRVVSIVYQEAFSGPIPHPRHLREYDSIVPGGADRIIRMTEDVLEHNKDIGQRKMGLDDKYRRLGMWLGFCAFVLMMVVAAVAGALGNNTLAGFVLASGVIGAIAAFIRGNGNANGDK